MAENKQVFAYLPERLVEFLDLVQRERGLKSTSATMMTLTDDALGFYAPKMREFLESEAQKRGMKSNDLLAVAFDVCRDVMRGVIG